MSDKRFKTSIVPSDLSIQGENIENVLMFNALAILMAPPSFPINALQWFVIAKNSLKLLPKTSK